MIRHALAGALLATIALAGPAEAQLVQRQQAAAPHFDLRDFNRATAQNPAVMVFNCREAARCGANATVSAELRGPLATMPTQAQEVQRQQNRANALRQVQGTTAVEVGQTAERTIGQARVYVTEKRVTRAGATGLVIDAVVMQGNRLFVVVSSGPDQDVARRNLDGMLNVAAFALENIVVATTAAPAPAAPAPAPAAPAPAPAPATPAPAPAPGTPPQQPQ